MGGGKQEQEPVSGLPPTCCHLPLVAATKPPSTQFTSSHHLGHYKVSFIKCQIDWTLKKGNFNEPSGGALNLLKFITNKGRHAKPEPRDCSLEGTSPPPVQKSSIEKAIHGGAGRGSKDIFNNLEIICFGRVKQLYYLFIYIYLYFLSTLLFWEH